MNKNVSRRAFPQRPSPGRHGFPWTSIQAVVAVSIRNPRLTILPLLLAVVVAAPGMFFLELRTDGQALKPANDPRILFDAQVRSHFDLRDPIAITIDTRSPEGIFNLPTLRIVSELSEKLAGLDGIGFDHVVSLATERRDRVYPGTLDFRFFLDPLPTTPELMEQLRQDLAAADIMTGTLTIDFTVGGTANDRLEIRDQGSGLGNVSISGSNVRYDFGGGPIVIGTFTGGTSGSIPLVVTLSANSDDASVEAFELR